MLLSSKSTTPSNSCDPSVVDGQRFKGTKDEEREGEERHSAGRCLSLLTAVCRGRAAFKEEASQKGTVTGTEIQ